MALFRQQCRGCGTLATGCIVLFCLLFVAPATGAGSARELAAERYKYAHLLLEDLHTVPVAELGEEQYLLVIDAFEKVHRTSPASSRCDDALLQAADLYREMISRFGVKPYKQKSIDAYEFLIKEYPHSKLLDTAREAIADIQKGLPPRQHAPASPVDVEDETVVAGAIAEQAQLDPGAIAEQAQPDPAAGAGEPVASALADPNAVAILSTRSLVIPVADKPNSTEQRKSLGKLEGVHFWSSPEYTRVVIELDDRVEMSYDTLPNPKRLFFDLMETRVSDSVLKEPSFEVGDAFLKKIRVAQFGRRSTRVVLDLERSLYFDVAWLSNPPRLVVEVRATDQPAMFARATPPPEPPAPAPASSHTARAAKAPVTTASAANEVAGKVEPGKSDPAANFARLLDRTTHPVQARHEDTPAAAGKAAEPDKSAPGETVAKTAETTESAPKASGKTPAKSAQTTAKAEPAGAAAKTGKTAKGKTEQSGKQSAQAVAKATDPEPSAAKKESALEATEDAAEESDPDEDIQLAKAEPPPLLDLPSPKPAAANARGQRNLIRALGLKVGRVVIDAGHGGHDTGSIGGGGLREKDLVLDIALRLGKLIEEGLGSEIIYTRNDDRFISLKERTTLANERKADLFISIHANSSRSRTVRGVETYYLNFTTDSWALTVASRENAASDRPVHELQDLLSKIALKEKIEESREFATRIQSSLYDGLGQESKNVRDRGVRKAPFMVLIGAKMPAVLAEIGFLSNAQTEKLLKTGTYRQKVANHLYQGILNYSESLGNISMARSEAAAIE